jgi:hypothetical protein
MRKIMIAAAAIIVMAAGIALVKDYSGAVSSPQSGVAAFELMSNAKDLPTPVHPDAF